MNITITQSASNKIAELLAEENNPAMRLRMYVQGGGCSGMSYGFAMDEELNEDDFEIRRLEKLLKIDSKKNKEVSAAKLNKEFEENEGISGGFGSFLMSLDNLTESINHGASTKPYFSPTSKHIDMDINVSFKITLSMIERTFDMSGNELNEFPRFTHI